MAIEAFLLAQAPEAAEVGVLGGLLCAAVGAILIGGLIGAVILRAAVALTNKVTGGAVPDPSFGKAFAMSIIAMIVNQVIQIALVFALSGTGNAQLIAQAIAIPVSFLVLAGVATSMLPTSFGRACLVALFYWLIGIAIVVVIAVLFALVLGGLRLAG